MSVFYQYNSLPVQTPVLCCRFHPVNTNLYVVASANGTVAVQNCSTGMTVATVETHHAPGHAERPVAMATTPSMMCVGTQLQCRAHVLCALTHRVCFHCTLHRAATHPHR